MLYKCAWTCCRCRKRGRPVQVHHIDKQPSNNVETNLVALCGPCHDEAHTKHELSQNTTASDLTYSKAAWEAEVAAAISGAMLPSANASSAIWTYVNHERLIHVLGRAGISFSPNLFDDLKAKNLIDQFGIPKHVMEPDPVKATWTVYDYIPFSERFALLHLDTHAVDETIRIVQPIDVDALNNKTAMQALIRPGCFVYTLRGFFFRTKDKQPSARIATRFAYARGRHLTIEFYLSTYNMFGDSSVYDSFSQHRLAAAFLHIKSIVASGNQIRISCTPIALGSGFLRLRDCSYQVLQNNA